MIKNVAKTVIFLAITLAVVMVLSVLFLPVWSTWTRDMQDGFYEQPKNTIQVACFGTSGVAHGFNPMEMYNQAGICAYSFGSGQQPLVVTYYWIREAERLHSESLKVVVLDPMMLFESKKQRNRTEFAEQGIARMQLSTVKIKAIRALQKRYGEENFQWIDELFPVVRYHSRWSELDQEDYDDLLGKGKRTYMHGNRCVHITGIDRGQTNQVPIPNYDITESIDYTTEEMESAFYSYKYNHRILDSIVQFCKDHDIELVFAKTLRKGYKDIHHDTLKMLADEYGIGLIDYNLPSVQEELDFNYPVDFFDGRHTTIYGSTKVTRYLTDYLKEHFEIDDIREDSRYDFMKEDADTYAFDVEDSKVQQIDDLEEYLPSLMDNERYTVLFSVKGDGSGLSDKARAELEDLGLVKLAGIGKDQSYVAIMNKGKVVEEVAADDLSESVTLKAKLVDGVVELTSDPAYNVKKDSQGLELTSAGAKAGDEAKQYLLGAEVSENLSGLNIVVYDQVIDRRIDTSCFDPKTGKRTSDTIPESYVKRLQKALSKAK